MRLETTHGRAGAENTLDGIIFFRKMGLEIFLATEKFKPSLTSLMKLFVSWHLTVYVSFAILIDVTHVCVIVIVAVVFVVVYNVVVFSGEDIGGQMREMAIFGVPCWGLMVSEGVPGSNDRAGEGQLPQSGHASLNTGKIYAPPWVALLFSSSGVGTGGLPVEALCLVYSIAVSLFVNNATAMLSLF